MLRRLMVTTCMVLVAFVAGMLTERSHQADLCETSGGQWMRAGFCTSEGR